MKGDGACLFKACTKELSLVKDEKIDYCTYHLRRQMVVHFVTIRDVLKDWIRDLIKTTYGTGEGGIGPFSIKSYLLYMLDPESWGDAISISLIASMWGIRMTCLLAETCGEVHYRHKGYDILDVDIALLFNCKVVNGHYSAVKRNDEMGMKCCKISLVEGYSIEEEKNWIKKIKDKKLGLTGSDEDEYVIIKRSRLVELLKAENLREELEKLLQKSGTGTGSKPVKNVNVTGKTLGRLAGESTEEDMEIGQNIPKPDKKQKNCEICNRQCPSHKALKNHMKQFHLGQIKFTCDDCDKNFWTRKGLDEHMHEHGKGGKEGSEGKLLCEKGCNDKSFTTDRARKRHYKDYHTKQKPKVCKHCGFKTKTKTLVRQHEMGCEKNKNRKELLCEVCEKGGFYLGKKVMAHKRKEHGW